MLSLGFSAKTFKESALKHTNTLSPTLSPEFFNVAKDNLTFKGKPASTVTWAVERI